MEFVILLSRFLDNLESLLLFWSILRGFFF
jgi:hypothetical protein